MPIEEQTQHSADLFLYPYAQERMGHRLTVQNSTVEKLAFLIKRNGSPPGNLTLTFRKVSDNSIIVSKVWGVANTLPLTPTWEEVEFDTPATIDEEVYLLAEAPGGDASNYVAVRFQSSDVKADEYVVRWNDPDWTVYTDWDMAYRYTYRSAVAPSSGSPMCQLVHAGLI